LGNWWVESLWYGASPLKWLLWPFSVLYAGLARARRALYRSGLRPVIELPVPVIVVGNIAAGGTGKTPTTVWLARELSERGFAVGLVSRGYRGRAKRWPQRVGADSDPNEVGDEPVLLAKLTACPVAAGPDRVAAAELLLSQHRLDVLLCDDGLQHYRLGRRFEIVVVDGARGLGNGLALPGGPLREPPSRLSEVDAVVVNGSGFALSGAFRAKLAPARLYQVAGRESRRLEEFANTEVHAVAGIGNPRRFFAMLEGAGLKVQPHPLPDHARIAASQLEFDDGAPVMITEKDAVKCASIAHQGVWAVGVELSFDGEDGARLMRRVVNSLRPPSE
jgi:tetraacyldisaccharide 4'-kinase